MVANTRIGAVSPGKETALLALADTISLALCGELKVPVNVEAPNRQGDLAGNAACRVAWASF